VPWNELKRLVGIAAQYRADMAAGAALGLVRHPVFASIGFGFDGAISRWLARPAYPSSPRWSGSVVGSENARAAVNAGSFIAVVLDGSGVRERTLSGCLSRGLSADRPVAARASERRMRR
jgi:hypothetical protein